ncbi:MAG: hypothetical protein LBL98_02065 [Ruminococcus sp.]|jgi:rubrerythrin|nr:hypothetical protein [Ruminococcus sp.]
MEINKEFVEKIKAATTAEQIVELFAENGTTVTVEDAENYIKLRAKYRDGIPEEELESVAGGIQLFHVYFCNNCDYSKMYTHLPITSMFCPNCNEPLERSLKIM